QGTTKQISLIRPRICGSLRYGNYETPYLAAVEAHLLAVGQHGSFEPDDLLAVGKLIADARDHVAGLDRRLGPAVRFHPIDGGPTDQPLFGPAVIGPDLEGNHRVRVCPRELGHGPL